MSAFATYLYAVGDATLAESVAADALTGVDGAPVRTVVEAGLAAVVSGVPSDRFSERSLRHAMEDLGWLEGTARAHHRVVDAVAEAHTVAPARLVTIYHDDGRLRAVLAEKAPGLAAVLDRLRGHSEWGVKAFAAPPACPRRLSRSSASA
ncbi:GvpL/GvpF family gas vesicle protein [Pseudonocardia acaciae]|uniref:GvpL/GvpF family gas vesicle protein n=1 Tax=Pseudonocardia acaciae TaxID=551276 RepID=UPI0006889C29|nr:GvpL/GvpF family gas vesicle protein [Pseudonocardia acaciae]